MTAVHDARGEKRTGNSVMLSPCEADTTVRLMPKRISPVTNRQMPKEQATQATLIPQPPKAAEIWQGYVEARWLRPIRRIVGRGYNAVEAPAPNPNEHLAYALHFAGYRAGTWTIVCRDKWFKLWAERQLHWLARELQDYVRQTYGAEVAYQVTFTAPAADIAY